MTETSAPAVAGQPRLILRLEGAALFAAALYAYWLTGTSWWLFVILFFAPDLSFAAYLVNPRIGALAYNAVHATIGPLALAAYGIAFGPTILIALAMIWAAHVGFDRMLGYGLKYPTAFVDTHLGRIGWQKPA
ncbi:MAG: DUF4260 domain-containing protein [Bradyrhizobiaceae bacterium]|nr:DUF4260 domain-containing protein [Bradyrhizobiaceae bacterium]